LLPNMVDGNVFAALVGGEEEVRSAENTNPGVYRTSSLQPR